MQTQDSRRKRTPGFNDLPETSEQIFGSSVQRHMEGEISSTMELVLTGSEINWELVPAANTKY